MFLNELFESKSKKILAIFPGRFQPWHLGHKACYDLMVQRFSKNNVFIATSNVTDSMKSPFTFQDKLLFMKATGINSKAVIQTKNPYRVEELTVKFNPETTILIFGVSKKDMDENPRFSFKPKKDGSPSYFQPLPSNLSLCKSLDKHGYIFTLPTINFTVLGEPMRSATEFRSKFAGAAPAVQKAMVKDMFGSSDVQLLELLRTKLVTNAINIK
jgi:hypothetical protein